MVDARLAYRASEPETVRATNANLPFIMIALLTFMAPPAAAQQQTGVLTGKVVAANGSPCRDAAVTVASEHNIGGARTQWTDADGRFRFLRLMPGQYTVSVDADGHRPSEQMLHIGLGGATRLVVHLEEQLPAGEVEVIEVFAERVTVDARRTDLGSSFDSAFLQSIPSVREYLSVPSLAPGVGAGIDPTIHGGSPHSNQYYVDGVNTTDPTTNTFSANFNYDAIQEVEVMTGGFHPRYGNVSGGIINIVTKSGSNTLRLDSSLYYHDPNLEVDAPDEQLLPEDERRVFWDVSANLNVSGPIVMDRLWFFASAEYNHAFSQNPSTSPIASLDGVEQPARVYQGLYWLLKLTSQIDPHNRLQALVQGDPVTVDNVNQDVFANPETEAHQAQAGLFGKLEWDGDYDPLLVKVRAAYKRIALEVVPQERVEGGFTVPGFFSFGRLTKLNDFGVAPGCLAPEDRVDQENGKGCTRDIQANPGFGQGLRIDRSDGSLYGGAGSDFQLLRERTDIEFELTYLLDHPFGEHHFDVGFQLTFKSDTSTDRSPGGASYFIDAARNPDGTPVPIAAFIVASDDNALTQQTDGNVYAAYIADRWTMMDRVTLEPGLRVEHATHRNHRDEPVLQFLTFSPRFGFAVDPFGDGHTRIHGGYARLFESGYFGLSKYASLSRQIRLAYWDPEAERYVEAPGSVFVQGGESSRVIDEELEPLYADEFRIGVERAFESYLSGGVVYIHRETRNAWEDREVNLIWSQSGERIVGSRAGDGQQIFELATIADARRSYDAVEFHIQRGGTPGWGLNGSYTLQWSEGTTADLLSSGFDNPRQDTYLHGPLPDDVRHAVKLQGFYSWNIGLTLGAVFRYESGAPYSAIYRDAAFERFVLRHAPRGRHPGADLNDPQDDRFLRLPDLTQLDLRIGWNFEPLIGHGISVSADVFNVFNSSTAVEVFDRADRADDPSNPSFGLPLSIQRPLRATFGLRYQY